jgi:hypothetical protein
MYEFNSKQVDGQSLIPVINLMLGNNLVGAEIGTFRAQTACTIIQNCPGIKKLYVIDSWTPYSDFIKEPYDHWPGMSLSEKDIEFIKLTALHNIKYSGKSENIEVMEMPSTIAASKIQNNSLDFVFLDSHLTLEQLESELHEWYVKVKLGGVFAVHDTHVSVVRDAVEKFAKQNSITKISRFDQTHMWIKNV